MQTLSPKVKAAVTDGAGTRRFPTVGTEGVRPYIEKGRLASRPGKSAKSTYSILALSMWMESPFTDPVAAM